MDWMGIGEAHDGEVDAPTAYTTSTSYFANTITK